MPQARSQTRPLGDPRRGVFADELTLRATGPALLTRASFAVGGGRHVGLAGRNGSGKTTLLDTIVTLAQQGRPPEHVTLEGSLRLARRLTVGHLPQSPRLAWRGTVSSYLDAHAGEVGAVWQAHERLAATLQEGAHDAPTLAAYGEALDAMGRVDGWSYEQRRPSVLHGLGLDPALLGRPVSSLSGGEATRLALAALLVAPSELLLLDEPTNNLDADAIAYLSRWVLETPAAVLLVSHDRDLLEVVDEIMEIEEGGGRLLHHGGGFGLMERERRAGLEAKQRAYAEQEARRARLAGAVAGLAGRAKAMQQRSPNDFYRHKGAKVARAAKAQAARVARELQQLEEPDLPAQPRYVVEPAALTSGALLRLDAVALGPTAAPLAFGVELRLDAGERVAVVGPNGSGKTTLLSVLAGGAPAAGRIWRHAELRAGLLPQVLPPAPPQTSLLAYAQRFTLMPTDRLRERLGKVLFADPAQRRAVEAREGELRRAALAALFAAAPDLLLLDEPTNHLDLPSVDQLEVALDAFTGAVVAVSHDRRFLRRLGASRTLVAAAGAWRIEPGSGADC